MTIRQLTDAYLRLRTVVREHLVRSMHARFMRKRARKFLAMRVTPPPSTWPKLNDNHSLDRFRRESGR